MEIRFRVKDPSHACICYFCIAISNYFEMANIPYILKTFGSVSAPPLHTRSETFMAYSQVRDLDSKK